ncbi:ribonuclease T2 [Pseudohalocynthiibacter aestuariivivens]|jgi:ribonuclease T2|uniref:Ribonuclease T2 n=1 Tax=Pseudohalocynthiibacter aestuariivivens TaxID=1591409 RepID=A0ABV5JKA3_9RHOB|nr:MULTISPECIES: ribonuclease T2 [Pseudohalocynthiibacter]MBS9717432.1 ribonuclease T2 [Pseudohalocynthiibacter aestuariivivens]MCK0102234.1 ribonuclease T2 [Pseudohalocynthiibacter sp. F2068]
MRWLFVLLLTATVAKAEGEQAGTFDYYILSLSWSPNWCALAGDARNADQCDARHDYGWIMHGLWPQYENGWPSFCNSRFRNPSRRQTRAMTDIMGSGGLAWHQWQKHGRCSGLSSEDYYAAARRAYRSVTRPPVFRRLPNAIRLPASVVEEAFLQSNPDLTAEMITITCESGYIQEARICMTLEMEFRKCGPDTRRDCAMERAIMEIVR